LRCAFGRLPPSTPPHDRRRRRRRRCRCCRRRCRCRRRRRRHRNNNDTPHQIVVRRRTWTPDHRLRTSDRPHRRRGVSAV